MQPTASQLIVQLAPLFLLTLPIAIGAAYIAPKMGANRWLWLVLLLTPIVNMFAMSVFFIRVMGAVLDRLNASDERMKNVMPFA
jgi:hypothetical protein